MHDASIHCDFDTLQNKAKIIIADYNIYYKRKNMFTTDFIDFTRVHIFSNWGKNLPIAFKKVQMEALNKHVPSKGDW
jgi:hypothetical protein